MIIMSKLHIIFTHCLFKACTWSLNHISYILPKIYYIWETHVYAFLRDLLQFNLTNRAQNVSKIISFGLFWKCNRHSFVVNLVAAPLMTSYFSSQRFGLVQDRLGCIPVLIMCVNYMHNMYLDFMNFLGYLEVYLNSNHTLIKTF